MSAKEIQGTLLPYSPSQAKPWNEARVNHLYNRIGSGCNLTELKEGLNMDPATLIDNLINEALEVPIPDISVFPWAEHPVFLVDDPYPHFNRVFRIHDVKRHLATNLILNPVKYKMVLFWSNHFVTENHPNLIHSGIPTYLYYRDLCQYALGNFEKFTEKMSLNPMMLHYLNGNSNTVDRPNENFARELLELFTLGDGNYSQDDIVNVAKGYTGWKAGTHIGYYNIGQFIFNPDEYVFVKEDHDWSTKVIFGEESNTIPQPSDDEEAKEFAYQEFQWIVNTILTKKSEEVAKFICGKLYKFYVYEEINEEIVAALAVEFQKNWEIVDVLRILFKSEHFFDANTIGIQIKSGVELFVQYVKKTGFEHNVHWYSSEFALHPDFDPDNPNGNGYLGNTAHNHAHWMTFQSGQNLLSPPNVAGWKGGRFWLNETSLLSRWSQLSRHILRLMGFDGWSTEELMDRPANQQFIADHLIELTDNSTDVEEVVKAVIKFNFSCPLDDLAIQAAVVAFKGNAYPENFYSDGNWHLGVGLIWWQYGRLMSHLVKRPEFQLT